MFLRAMVLFLLSSTLLACSTQKHTLYLARHGQTSWNRVSRFQGDPDLDAVGYLNRVNLWNLMRKEKLAHIYTSELKRTQRTAELLAKYHKLPLRRRRAMNEIAAGILVGICFKHMAPGTDKKHAKDCLVRARHVRLGPALKVVQKAWSDIKSGGLAGKAPLGENYFAMRKRAKPFVPELMMALDDGKVLVVGHGLINRVYLHLLAGWPLPHVKRLKQFNDQVYRFEGVGTKNVVVSLYTPGFGWKRCTPPTQGQKQLDCNPGLPKKLHVMAKGLGGPTPPVKATVKRPLEVRPDAKAKDPPGSSAPKPKSHWN